MSNSRLCLKKFEFVAALLICLVGFLPASAMEQIRFDSLHPEDADRLRFFGSQNIAPGGEIGKFRFGSWPFPRASTIPFPTTGIQIVRGRIQDTSWANAYLLRVLPAAFYWATNASLSGPNNELNMGRDPIVMSFDEPICAFGALYAQSGAHNPHHPDLRRRTTFHFFDEDGTQIASFDQKPGHFMSQAAFQRDWRDRLIWAVAIDSEVHFALKEVIAMPCSRLIG